MAFGKRKPRKDKSSTNQKQHFEIKKSLITFQNNYYQPIHKIDLSIKYFFFKSFPLIFSVPTDPSEPKRVGAKGCQKVGNHREYMVIGIESWLTGLRVNINPISQV